MLNTLNLQDSIILPDLMATRQIGQQWASACRGGEIFALSGDLGAGKTELARSLVFALGYEGEVTSPTFTLIHEYVGGRLPVCHADLYRLESIDEIRKIGLEEYLPHAGITIIEWPDKAVSLLPLETQWWHLTLHSDGKRTLSPRPPHNKP